MKFTVEIQSLHDMIMLDTIIDLWKAQWKAEEADTEEDDDEETVPDGDTNGEEESRAEAINRLADAIYSALCGDLHDSVSDSDD